MRAFVSGNLRFTIENASDGKIDGEDSAIASLPPAMTFQGMVDPVGARRVAEMAAHATCAMVDKILHHADVVVTKDKEVIAGLTDWKHCPDCFLGYTRALNAMDDDPEMFMIGMVLYFASDDSLS